VFVNYKNKIIDNKITQLSSKKRKFFSLVKKISFIGSATDVTLFCTAPADSKCLLLQKRSKLPLPRRPPPQKKKKLKWSNFGKNEFPLPVYANILKFNCILRVLAIIH